MRPRELSTLSMWPTTRLAKLDSAHVISWPSMQQWGKSVNPLIDIALNFHPIFAVTAYQVFLTTSSIVMWVRTLKCWSLPLIVGDRVTGLAGFNWSIDPTTAGHLQR